MSWKVSYLPEAIRDMKALDGSQRALTVKALHKVAENPLPQSEGGYGKPLGNHDDTKLAGLMKIKLRGTGIRIVYKLFRTETEMLVVVVGLRADNEAYEIADQRAEKHDL